MRTSKLFFQTLKETPHEAETISHQLLERAGYICQLKKGFYTHTPLMWRVLKKIMEIIREELDRSGAQEISMPFLHPSEIWKETKRWEDFTAANLLYTLQDREGHSFCLAPTHEEVVTSLVAGQVTTYKKLPFNLYQIGTKFRDEIRPRFGLIRCKEFLMKDGYSFSSGPDEMEEQYQIMRQCYSRIFKRLEFDFMIVEAHGGKIGSGKSEEFQVKADIGEDVVLVADDYVVNLETARSTPPPFSYSATMKDKEKIETPNIKTIETLASFCKVAPQQILKTLVYKLIFADRKEFVAIAIRGDRQLNDLKVATHFNALEIALATEEEVAKLTGSTIGFVGPLNGKLPFYADLTTQPMTNFVSASNEVDIHYLNINWEKDLPTPEFFDFLLAEEGDECPFVPGRNYKTQKGIEVGHIFNLGTRYTEKLGAYFQDENGKTRPFWMGTYGIGVGRCAAALVEQKHDDKGIIWPLAIAPFKILITAATIKDSDQLQMAETLYHQLETSGYEPLLDDRDQRLGFKLKDSDLIGIPFKLVVGRAFSQEGKIEIESREGHKDLIPVNEL
ncbi:MAG: proline--tRNA ligase, partial [Chlamydiales bacterium]